MITRTLSEFASQAFSFAEQGLMDIDPHGSMSPFDLDESVLDEVLEAERNGLDYMSAGMHLIDRVMAELGDDADDQQEPEARSCPMCGRNVYYGIFCSNVCSDAHGTREVAARARAKATRDRLKYDYGKEF